MCVPNLKTVCARSLIAQKNDTFDHFPTGYQVTKFDSYSIRYNYMCENTHIQPDSVDVSKSASPQSEVLSCLGPCGSVYVHYICRHFRTKTRLGGKEREEEKRIGFCAAGSISITCPLTVASTLHHTKTLQSRWLVENKKEKEGRFP